MAPIVNNYKLKNHLFEPTLFGGEAGIAAVGAAVPLPVVDLVGTGIGKELGLGGLTLIS